MPSQAAPAPHLQLPLRSHTQLCPADDVRCPTCTGPVRRVTLGKGSAVATCDNLVERVGARGRERVRCSCKMFIATSEWGFAVPIRVSADEFEYLTHAPLATPDVVLRRLGILRGADSRDVAVERCARCEEPTKRFHLYAGSCRWCDEGTSRPPGDYIPPRP